ncbi:unnamed protein product [Arctogadus glacialis]
MTTEEAEQQSSSVYDRQASSPADADNTAGRRKRQCCIAPPRPRSKALAQSPAVLTTPCRPPGPGLGIQGLYYG